MNPRTYCANCNAIWGIDEIDRGKCAACGWRVGDPVKGMPEFFDAWDEDEDYDEEYDDEYGTCSCQYCTCHQRAPYGGVCSDCARGAHQG